MAGVTSNGADHISDRQASDLAHVTPVAYTEASQAGEGTVEDGEAQIDETPFEVKIILPRGSDTLKLVVSPLEMVHEVRQTIMDHPQALQYSCFHLDHGGSRINDFATIHEVDGLREGSELRLMEDPYVEKDARIHFLRVRELVGVTGDRSDAVEGMCAGVHVLDDIPAGDDQDSPIMTPEAEAKPKLEVLVPRDSNPAPKTVKAMSLSPWNPPPPHLRLKGHLLYLVITTNEGEQYQITSHVGGFYVNKSSNNKFDPFPRPDAKGHQAHSLLTLLHKISPSFESSCAKLREYNDRKDPLSTFPIGNVFPVAPWLLPANASTLSAHTADIIRTQEALLLGGTDSIDNLRDWNEEFQSTRELPKESIQDRIFRERLLMKLHADYNDAVARGAVLVARGEVAPLNPTEVKDAQIFIYNNIFFSFGADAAATFTSEGGDDAARVATGRDVHGIQCVNQLDLDGLYTAGTVVLDYMGKRIVGQSVVPGLFKQPESGGDQIQYGAIDGKGVVAADERFAAHFAKLADALHIKRHAVWDKDKKRFDLEASVEMKGMVGTDGRKYVLDLYRITPLDIAWMEDKVDGPAYPHTMTVLRPELVESLHAHKALEYMNGEMVKMKEVSANGMAKTGRRTVEISEDEAMEDSRGKDEKAQDISDDGTEKSKEKNADATEGASSGRSESDKPEGGDVEAAKDAKSRPPIDMSKFKFALNPDIHSGQEPQTDAEKEEYRRDEKEVMEACTYLRETVIPDLLKDLENSAQSFPLDGRSLTNMLHKRGINMRYLGMIAVRCDSGVLVHMRGIVVRDIIVRAFKHVAARYSRDLPQVLLSVCFAHLLNCLLGVGLNEKPTADVDEQWRELYSGADLAFEKVTPESLRETIQHESARRFRYVLEDGWWTKTQRPQLLREVAMRLGLQLRFKHFVFDSPRTEGDGRSKTASHGHSNGENKKKKKSRDGSPTSTRASTAPHTFVPDDIINVVPRLKQCCPRSSLADEALAAGRTCLARGDRKLGEELLLESSTLHDQIYGPLHPYGAQVSRALSQMYHSLGQKDSAAELARKAVIVAERTTGIDSAETVLEYLNYSLALHQSGKSRAALAYAKHALDVLAIIYGPDHPDTVTTMNNIAVMCQSLKAFRESRVWFEEALRLTEKIFGSKTLHSASILFQLAQALALDRDPNGAVRRMHECRLIFQKQLGDDDKNTQEAQQWLETLTTNAIQIKHHEQAVMDQARRMRIPLLSVRRSGASASPVDASRPLAQFAAGSATHVSAHDTRDINDLVTFINGDKTKGKSSKTGGKSSGRGNPKMLGNKATSALA